jgi:anti-anti-sigma factor
MPTPTTISIDDADPFHVIVVDRRALERSPTPRSVVVVMGEIDMATVPLLCDVLLGELESGKTDLVIDLAHVEFIDVIGVRTLLHVADAACALGGRVRIQAASPALRRICDLLGVGGVLLAEG